MTVKRFGHMIEAYIKSAARFRDLAVGAGADVIITNHSEFDNSFAKLNALATRKRRCCWRPKRSSTNAQAASFR